MVGEPIPQFRGGQSHRLVGGSVACLQPGLRAVSWAVGHDPGQLALLCIHTDPLSRRHPAPSNLSIHADFLATVL